MPLVVGVPYACRRFVVYKPPLDVTAIGIRVPSLHVPIRVDLTASCGIDFPSHSPFGAN